MRKTHQHRSALVVLALMLAALLAWPAASLAQTSTVTGQATAVQVVVLGFLGTARTTTLASTTLSGTNNESDVGQDTGNVPSVLGAEVLNAATYSYSDEVDSAASLANFGLTVAGVNISADSVMAQASQVSGATGGGSSYIDNLAINGVPVTVTGTPNQTIAIPGGQMVIDEQTISSTGGAVVNAIHVVVNGVADVVLASATAGIS